MDPLTDQAFYEQILGPSHTPAERRHLLRDASLLCRWMEFPPFPPEDGNSIKARYAPSVIARSDATLFGVSGPRFAVRLYPEDQGGSFVNFRRTAALWSAMSQAQKESIKEASPRLMWEEATVLNPFAAATDPYQAGWRILEKVGDCFLEVPSRFRRRYRIAMRRMAKAFGEGTPGADATPPHEGPYGTTFVRYFDASGVCGQACGFMVACLLEAASSVHGLHEISYWIAQDPVGSGFNIKGMTFPELESYASVLGLAGDLQHVHDLQKNPDPDVRYGSALRGYLNSRIPVIVMVDLNRLNGYGSGLELNEPVGDPIHVTNRTGVHYPQHGDDQGAGLRYQPKDSHYVVLVGCSKDPSSNSFLMHEPSSLPYLEITLDQLVASRPYLDEHGDRSLLKLHERSLMAWVEQAVTLPLLSQHLTGGGVEAIRVGLLDLLELYGHSISGEFLLGKAEDIRRRLQQEPWSIPSGVIAAACDAIDRLDVSPSRWLWIQLQDTTYRIWDAQTCHEVPRFEDLPPNPVEDLLLAPLN